MITTTNRIGQSDESTRIVKALHIAGKTAIDLGCGTASHTLPLGDVMLVDAIKMKGAPKGVMISDIRDVAATLGSNRFGAVYLLDVIEHLTKAEGVKVLKDLESYCDRIVFFTPIGDLWVTNEDHPYSHKCGWTPQEAVDLGFEVWEWPIFHQFAFDQLHGAFWAWKSLESPNPTVAEISQRSGVSI